MKYTIPNGRTELPPVWSPWSEHTTMYLIGLGVTLRIASTSPLVASGLP